MRCLSVAHILQLHVIAIQKYGGSEGLRDLGRLEAAVAAQTQEVFGEELYPNLFQKAAAVGRGIIADHPLVDGNKRTGMLSALTLLEINGFVFKADLGELEDFAVRIAVEHLDIPTIAAWLEVHASHA